MAVLVLLMLALGFLIEAFPKGTPERTQIFAAHMTFGLCILALVCVRIYWRATHAVPPLPGTISSLLRSVARLTHYLLYALMLGLPLVGWMLVSMHEKPEGLRLLGGIYWPQLLYIAEKIGPVQGAGDVLFEMHSTGAWVLIVLISLHAGAALLHHFALRDDTLMRIVPKRLHPALHRLRGTVR